MDKSQSLLKEEIMQMRTEMRESTDRIIKEVDLKIDGLQSKISTLQWVGGLLTVGMFLPLVIMLWQTIFNR